MISALMPTYDRYSLQIKNGSGCYLFDAQGRRYLDFGSGIAVNSLGHCHPKLVSAITEQASRIWHCSNLYDIPAQQKLANRLVSNTFADTVFFNNSGAEAIETGIKIIRKFHYESGNPEKYRIITIDGAFHGRTLATISASRQKKYITGFGPLVEGFDQVPFNNLKILKETIGPHTGGVLIEPIQGEGGIRPFSDDYLVALRTICDENGLLLMFDEVQSGVGRTGKFYAYEWTKMTPDIMASAKGLGVGFPVGACLATEQAGLALTAGSHGTTFGGNPMAMAVSNAVLDIIFEKNFLNNVKQKGKYFQEKLNKIKEKYPRVINEVRGVGLMTGIKLSVDNNKFMKKLMDNKMLTVKAEENVIRLFPPLIVNNNELDEAINKIEKVCKEMS